MIAHHRPLLQLPDDGFGNLGRSGVAVWVPPGVYRITKMLQIQQVNATQPIGHGRTRSIAHSHQCMAGTVLQQR